MQLARAKLSRVLRHCNWQGLCNSPPVQPALFAFPRLRWPRSSPKSKKSSPDYLIRTHWPVWDPSQWVGRVQRQGIQALDANWAGGQGCPPGTQKLYHPKNWIFGNVWVTDELLCKRRETAKKGQQTWDRFVCYICRTSNKGSSCYYMLEIKPQVHLNWNWLRGLFQK